MLSMSKVVGRFGRSLTFNKLTTTILYLSTGEYGCVLNEIANSGFKGLIRALIIEEILRYPKAMLPRDLTLGLRLGSSMRGSGSELNLYKAPPSACI